MKAFYFLALAMLLSSIAFSQTDSVEVEGQPYYVVIGVFANPKNAIRYTRLVPRYQLNARYEMNFNKGLHYVYVMKTNDRTQAIDEALKLRIRPDSLFKEAWVYHGSFKKPLPGQEVNNVVITVPEKTHEHEAVTEPQTSKKEAENIVSRPFIFKFIRRADSAQVSGQVNVIDLDLAKKIGTYDVNEEVSVIGPKGKSGRITLSTHAAGYRRMQHTINFLNPQADSVEMQDSTVVVTFELTPLQKGDVTVSEIYFYRDATVMRPESRYEMNSLVTMMNENPRYRIRIHGHTNGNGHGRIIYMSDKPEDWFALQDTKNGKGSAKALSQARAEVVKRYLVTQGIDATRLEVKAWGGKKPLYDELSKQAQANVRVEIEILQD